MNTGSSCAVGRVDRVRAGEDAGLLLVLLPVQVGLAGGRRGRRRRPRPGWPRRRSSAGRCPPASSAAVMRRPAGARGPAPCRSRRTGCPVGWCRPRCTSTAGAARRSANREAHPGAVRAADPVALHGLDRLRPVQPVQVVDQPVGVGGDPHHPLPQGPPEDREVADRAAALGGDLLVGQHRAQAGAPVHRRLVDVGQPVSGQHLMLLDAGQLGPGPTVRRRARRRRRTRRPAR